MLMYMVNTSVVFSLLIVTAHFCQSVAFEGKQLQLAATQNLNEGSIKTFWFICVLSFQTLSLISWQFRSGLRVLLMQGIAAQTAAADRFRNNYLETLLVFSPLCYS